MSYTPTTWTTGDIITATKLNNIESGVQSVNSSYTPTTWATGDIITAEKLNKIEQGIANASGGETWITLTEESVTVGDKGEMLTYNTQITADTIKVTLNGTEYTVSPIVDTAAPFGTSYIYGAPWSEELDRYDYSTYPFSVVSTSNGANVLHTETAGTYSIKIEAPQSGGSSDFSTAEVTIVNDSESYFEFPMAIIRDGEMYFDAISEEATYTTPLYDGSVILPSFNPANVSGNAEKKGSGISAYVEITGDCTITISDSSSDSTDK